MASMARTFHRRLQREGKIATFVEFKDGSKRAVILNIETVDGERKIQDPRSVETKDKRRYMVDAYNNDVRTGQKVEGYILKTGK